MTIKEFKNTASSFKKTPRMSAVFVGHGSPMNALENNVYSRAWASLGKELPTPNAILCVSAHWLTDGTYVHVAEKPKTIHDFYGFPKELYEVNYPCPGAPKFAEEVRSLAKKTTIEPDTEWGVDHGTWSVLCHMFPKADVPVFQMSIDFPKPGAFHYELARELASLREKGVLIIGSGNIVHNLGVMQYAPDAKPFDWALEFDAGTKDLLEKGDHSALAHYEKLGHAANLSVPTPDHYYPMLYTIGLQEAGEKLTFFLDGITNGSVSMRAFVIGK